MQPGATELHAAARRNQFLADAERHRLVRQAQLQRGSWVATSRILMALVPWAGVGPNRLASAAQAA